MLPIVVNLFGHWEFNNNKHPAIEDWLISISVTEITRGWASSGIDVLLHGRVIPPSLNLKIMYVHNDAQGIT